MVCSCALLPGHHKLENGSKNQSVHSVVETLRFCCQIMGKRVLLENSRVSRLVESRKSEVYLAVHFEFTACFPFGIFIGYLYYTSTDLVSTAGYCAPNFHFGREESGFHMLSREWAF